MPTREHVSKQANQKNNNRGHQIQYVFQVRPFLPACPHCLQQYIVTASPCQDPMLAFANPFSEGRFLLCLNSLCSPDWPQTHSSPLASAPESWGYRRTGLCLAEGYFSHCLLQIPSSECLQVQYQDLVHRVPTAIPLLGLHLPPLRVLFPHHTRDPQLSHPSGDSLRFCLSLLTSLTEFCSSWSLS